MPVCAVPLVVCLFETRSGIQMLLIVCVCTGHDMHHVMAGIIILVIPRASVRIPDQKLS